MSRPETHGVTTLEPAGREEQLERWGIPADYVGQRFGRRERFLVDASPDDDVEDEHEQQAHQFLVDGGWSSVDVTRGRAGLPGAAGGARDAGMSSHRGVLHPDEHVDADALRSAVEDELGFTYADVHAVYRQGKKSDAQLELRARIDARLLELARAGGNLTLLGRALGFPVKDNGNVRALENALARARQKERT